MAVERKKLAPNRETGGSDPDGQMAAKNRNRPGQQSWRGRKRGPVARSKSPAGTAAVAKKARDDDGDEPSGSSARGRRNSSAAQGWRGIES